MHHNLSRKVQPELPQKGLGEIEAAIQKIARRALFSSVHKYTSGEIYVEIVRPVAAQINDAVANNSMTEHELRKLAHTLTMDRIRKYKENDDLLMTTQATRSDIRALYDRMQFNLRPLGEAPTELGKNLQLLEAISDTDLQGRDRIRDMVTSAMSGMHVEGITKRYIIQNVFSMLEWDDHESSTFNMKKIEEAGISITHDHKIDLSNTVDNKFTVTIFKTKHGYMSGYQILKNANCASLLEFCTNKMPNNGIISPEDRDLKVRYTEPNQEPTSEECLSAIRDLENFEKLQSLGVITINNGKWRVRISNRNFKSSWLSLNGGKKKGGKKIIELTAETKKFSQVGVQQVLELVFGTNYIEFIKGRNGPTKMTEILTNSQLIEAIRTDENFSILSAKGGITVNGNVVNAIVNLRELRKLKLNIRGEYITIANIILKLNLPNNWSGLLELLRMVFPDKTIVRGCYTNGIPVHRFNESHYKNLLQTDENKQVIKDLCSTTEDGKIIVDINTNDIRNVSFEVNGKKVGFHAIANALDLTIDKRGLHDLCCIIFGPENVENYSHYRNPKTGYQSLTAAQIIEGLSSLEANRSKLMQHTEPLEGSEKRRVKPGMRMQDFGTFKIFDIDREVGMKGILNKLNLPHRKASIITVYTLVFGEAKISTS